MPAGLHRLSDGSARVRVVSHYLVERMRCGGIARAFFILRKGKWDIPEYYGAGESFGLDVGYLIARLPYGAAYSIDQAYAFIRGARVALGFPDILVEPEDVYLQALARLEASQSDIVLGLYRARPTSSDLVSIDGMGRVIELVIRPRQTPLTLTWIMAVWGPRFTEFLHEYLAVPRTSAQVPGAPLPEELTIGHVIQAAIREGLTTHSITFPCSNYLDIGTPDGLRMVTGSGLLQRKPLTSEH
jgi:glucose-1-phosphate thymidylyltransferase